MALARDRATADRRRGEGRHLILGDRDGDHRLWMMAPQDVPLAVLIPLDPDFVVRMQAARRLHRRLAGRAAGPLPRVLRLTRQRRTRLTLMLHALDGSLAGATYRNIAEHLFGADRVTERGWKTLSLRSQTIRLVRDGIACMNGGYRDLLRGD